MPKTKIKGNSEDGIFPKAFRMHRPKTAKAHYTFTYYSIYISNHLSNVHIKTDTQNSSL